MQRPRHYSRNIMGLYLNTTRLEEFKLKNTKRTIRKKMNLKFPEKSPNTSQFNYTLNVWMALFYQFRFYDVVDEWVEWDPQCATLQWKMYLFNFTSVHFFFFSLHCLLSSWKLMRRDKMVLKCLQPFSSHSCFSSSFRSR